MAINNQIPIGSKVIDQSGSMTNEWWRFFYNFATNSGAVTNITLDNDGLNIKGRTGDFVLTIEPGSTFTANRVLTITTGDADRTFTLGGDLNVTGDATLVGDNTGDQNLFASIPVSGQTTVTADTTSQALTLVAGTHITITTNNTTKAITFTTTGLAGSGANSDITSMSGLNGDVGKPSSVTLATGGAIRTNTVTGNTALLQAYDVDGVAYTTFATLTAGNTPTFDLSSSTTLDGSAIVIVGANSTITNLTGLTGAISKPTSITMATTGGFRTDTTSTNTALLQAYNTGSSSYTTFGTLTAGATPTFNLSSSVTLNSNNIVNLSGASVAGNIPVFSNTTGAVVDGGSNNITVATIYTLNVGASGHLGTINLYPSTANRGNITITTQNLTAGVVTSITFLAQATSNTYQIIDAGANANFVMTTSGSGQTISGNWTLSGAQYDFTGAVVIFRQATETQFGRSGTVAKVTFYPPTASKGKIAITPANNAGDTITTLTNDSQAAARSYSIPDAGGDAKFYLRYSETVTVSTTALSTSAAVSRLNIASAGSVTLAAPATADIGMVKLITMQTDGGDITLALTNVIGQSSGTTATFDDAGDALVVMATPSAWLVLREYGITLS